MSYRAFKRLLGETSLERKCRFLFGAATLLLITGSFWWYARQTEDLAYEQIATTGRLLVKPVLTKLHENLLRPRAQGKNAAARGNEAPAEGNREEQSQITLKEWKKHR